jgi:hypothetical protein
MTYITRNGKIEAENERGEKVEGLAEVKQQFREWGFSTAKASTRKRAQTVNFVLSMPAGTDPQAVLAAARGFAKERFASNHQYLMALHTPETDPDPKAPPHPHVHLSVKAQGFDLTWLKRTKADLQEWREVFAQKLRDQGVEAEATPRRSRGVIRKANKQAMHHLAKTPKRSEVMKAKVEEVIREVQADRPAPAKPWDEAIEQRQAQIRATYADVERDLRAAADADSRKAADQLATFLKGLPPIETQKAKLKRQLVTMLEADRGAQKSQEGPESGRQAPNDGPDMPEGGREK